MLVIGGGVAGLVTALDLAGNGHRPVLIEATDRFGGVLSAHQVGGLTLDAGAESFATARPAVIELLGELGLADRVVPPNPVGAWVRHRAGTAPLPAVGLLGIPGRWWAADVRRVIGISGVARSAADAVLPARAGVPAGTTLGAMVRTRMGRRVADRLVEPVAGGVYAADPDRLEVRTVAPGLDTALRETGSLAGAVRRLRGGGERSGSAVATLTGGLHTLVPALVDGARAPARCCTPDRRCNPCAPQVMAGSALSPMDHSSLPPPLCWQSPPRRRRPCSALRYRTANVCRSAGADHRSVLICTLVLDDHRLDRAPRGTGVLVSAHASGVTAKALTHATAKWPWLAETAGAGRHVLRLSYGRGGTTCPPRPTCRRSRYADASELLGVPLAPVPVVDAAVVRWASALPAPRPGHAAAVTALRNALAPLRLHVVGAPVAGSGLAGVVADARMQAAVISDALKRCGKDRSPAGCRTSGARPPGEGGWNR